MRLFNTLLLCLYLHIPVPCDSVTNETGKHIEEGSCEVAIAQDGSTSTSTSTIADKACHKEVGVVELSDSKYHHFPNCRLYLAPSTLPSAGLGVFTAESLHGGQAIAHPDVIIQVNDYNLIKSTKNNDNNKNDGKKNIGALIDEYSWDAQKFGGQFEGKVVASILPGIGSLANAQTKFKHAKAIPFRPDVDEADVPRTTKPGAGALTHYHNLTFFASQTIEAGEEIFVHYDDKDPWFKTRLSKMRNNTDSFKNEMVNDSNVDSHNSKREVDWIVKNGICLDNIKPGHSKIKGAGRGAFSTRLIPKGTIITATPLVLIENRDSLVLPKKKQQLLRNYCFGHSNSSLLFFPTSPVVNLINHANAEIISEENPTKKSAYTYNAKLQWSAWQHHEGRDWPQNLSLEQIKESKHSSGLVMEYVATRDIMPKEEILLDYGTEWLNAWINHEKAWKPPINAQAYSPSYIMDDIAGLLRTEKEQLDHPYASNIVTSCFYKYAGHTRNDGIDAHKTQNTKSAGQVTTVKWEMGRRTFDFSNLRPCSIMQREKLPDGQFIYTVMIKNRPGLVQEDIIPKGQMHVVSSVPRGAIRFTDKMYSTDQHLTNAFRHEIGIPNEIFPEAWKDL
mmetsp:Transcript_6380/g.7154  ORF Transcript_6380/g.7154 Transcript_6380/m.7154 type:complete len:618 (-) Transcript_6380:68-1921(-)